MTFPFSPLRLFCAAALCLAITCLGIGSAYASSSPNEDEAWQSYALVSEINEETEVSSVTSIATEAESVLTENQPLLLTVTIFGILFVLGIILAFADRRHRQRL